MAQHQILLHVWVIFAKQLHLFSVNGLKLGALTVTPAAHDARPGIPHAPAFLGPSAKQKWSPLFQVPENTDKNEYKSSEALGGERTPGNPPLSDEEGAS